MKDMGVYRVADYFGLAYIACYFCCKEFTFIRGLKRSSNTKYTDEHNGKTVGMIYRFSVADYTKCLMGFTNMAS